MVKTNMQVTRLNSIIRPPWITALSALCLLLGNVFPVAVQAQEVSDRDSPPEQYEAQVEVEEVAPAVELKPWLINPYPVSRSQAWHQCRRLDRLSEKTGCRIHAVDDRTFGFIL